jgi:hypothetical protein
VCDAHGREVGEVEEHPACRGDGAVVFGAVVVPLWEDECLAAVHLVGEDAVGEAVLCEPVPLAAVCELDGVLSRGDLQVGEIICLEEEVEGECASEDAAGHFEDVVCFEGPLCDGGGRDGKLFLDEREVECEGIHADETVCGVEELDNLGDELLDVVDVLYNPLFGVVDEAEDGRKSCIWVVEAHDGDEVAGTVESRSLYIPAQHFFFQPGPGRRCSFDTFLCFFFCMVTMGSTI